LKISAIFGSLLKGAHLALFRIMGYRHVQQGFPIDGIVLTFVAFGAHVAAADVDRPLAVHPAVRHGTAAVGQVHDAA
jgi:hypothetical protein